MTIHSHVNYISNPLKRLHKMLIDMELFLFVFLCFIHMLLNYDQCLYKDEVEYIQLFEQELRLYLSKRLTYDYVSTLT